MSYNKLGFTSGQTLKAEHLNHMEEGIANAGSTSWDNITDKPSYLPVMETSIAYILPETQLIADGDGQFRGTELVEGIEVENTYVVTYNGVEYTCEAEQVDAGGMIYTGLGNIGAAFGTPNENGEPFCVVIAPSNIAAQVGYNLMVMAVDGATEVTMAIRGDVMTYTKKLDNKCLDMDWIPTRKTTPYKEEMVVAHEAVIGEGFNGGLSEYCTYEVSFDGILYYLPGIYRDLGAVRTERYIGNRTLCEWYLSDTYGHVEDTGEPFLIRSYLGPNEDTTTFYAADGGEHTISISILLNDYNKMPECYLPESVSGIVVRSSTLGSTKKFKLTVDDSGTVTAKEITA